MKGFEVDKEYLDDYVILGKGDYITADERCHMKRQRQLLFWRYLCFLQSSEWTWVANGSSFLVG